MTDAPVPVALASASSTRRDLLAQVVTSFEAVPAQIDESGLAEPDPRRRVRRLARAKAAEVAARRPEALVIGADTLVVCRGEMIGKPADRADAVRILTKLNRHPHRVLTGLCLIAPDGRERLTCVEAAVSMRPMSRRQIEDQVDRQGALDRAGAYALEPDDPHLESLEGSITAVMGLPLDELRAMLRGLYPQWRGEG